MIKKKDPSIRFTNGIDAKNAFISIFVGFSFIAGISVVELKDSIINFEWIIEWIRPLKRFPFFESVFVIFIIRIMNDGIGNWEKGEKQNTAQIRNMGNEHLVVGKTINCMHFAFDLDLAESSFVVAFLLAI